MWAILISSIALTAVNAKCRLNEKEEVVPEGNLSINKSSNYFSPWKNLNKANHAFTFRAVIKWENFGKLSCTTIPRESYYPINLNLEIKGKKKNTPSMENI